jgi:hypothetical protein
LPSERTRHAIINLQIDLPPTQNDHFSPWWIVPFSCASQTSIPIAQQRSTGDTFGFDLHTTTGWKQVLLKKPISLKPVPNKNRLF